jgi:hypothetical protein
MKYMCQAEIPSMFLVRLDQVTAKVVSLSLIQDVQPTNRLLARLQQLAIQPFFLRKK